MQDMEELIEALEKLTQANKRIAENIKELRAIMGDRPDNHIEEGLPQSSSNKEFCQEAI